VHRQLQLLIALDDLIGFVQAEQSVVDENALQPIANRAVNERRGDGGIHATRQRADDPLVAHPLANARRRFLDERRDGPVTGAAAHIEREVAEDFLPALGVRHFGMEEQRVIAALGRFHCRDGRVGAGGGDGKTARRGRDEIAVARPHA
jgi:hypothetical protein